MDVHRSALLVVANSSSLEAGKSCKVQLAFISHGIKVWRAEQQDLECMNITSSEGLDSLKLAQGSTSFTCSTSKDCQTMRLSAVKLELAPATLFLYGPKRVIWLIG